MKILKKPVYIPSALTVVFSSIAFGQSQTGIDQGINVQPVGQPPPVEQAQPEIAGVPDIGGVLTPRGRLVLEPELQYSHASVNRITFRGVEILETLAIGALAAEDTDRDTWTASVTARYGATDRLELEMKVPYVYRYDTFRAAGPSPVGPQGALERNLSGDGLGDIELAAHYQLNQGRGNTPFFIGNLRYKSNTGDGPFDIRRDSDGVERELATGSGFHSIEPSITVLFPSDPAVYFANIGYLHNFKESVNQLIRVEDEDNDADDFFITKVDPGDAVRISFGMAYSINPRSSFTLGYKNDFIDRTKTTFEQNSTRTTQKSSTLNVGSMLLGWSYQLNQDTALNLGLEFGVTDDAPDVALTFRVPFGMDLF